MAAKKRERYENSSVKAEIGRRVLRSWFTAVHTPYRAVGDQLLVAGVKVAVACESDRLPVGALVVPAVDIGSAEVPRAMAAFHALTATLGLGTPVPVQRGAAPPKAELYGGQDFFLVTARHREFRSSPDLPPDQAQAYRPVILRAARRFFRGNRRMCETLGYEVQDLVTWGWVWAHVFAHKMAPPLPLSKDGLILLAVNLRQRFRELHRDFGKQLAVTQLNARSYVFASTGEVLGGSSSPDTDLPEEPEIPKTKRPVFAEALRSKLAALPCVRLVAALSEQVLNPDRDYATAAAAYRLLVEHRGKCQGCSGIEVPRLSQRREPNRGRREQWGQEDAAAGDAAGAAE